MMAPLRCPTRSPLCRAKHLQTPEHREKEIDREQPNENYLPEAQVARCPMIGHHFRISTEEPFPDAEDIRARYENECQTNAEHDPKGQHRIVVGMDDCERQKVHAEKIVAAGVARNCLRSFFDWKASFFSTEPRCITTVDPGKPR